MLYLCPVSFEAGGGIPCWLYPAATLLVPFIICRRCIVQVICVRVVILSSCLSVLLICIRNLLLSDLCINMLNNISYVFVAILDVFMFLCY